METPYRNLLIVNPFKDVKKLTAASRQITSLSETEALFDIPKTNFEENSAHLLKVIMNDSVFSARLKIKIDLQTGTN